MIQPDAKVRESQLRKDFAHGGYLLDLDRHRCRADRVDIALIKLAESSLRRPICPPHRLNLIPLEEPRQAVLMFGDDSRERNREVVTQREIGLTACLVLAASQNLENELVAFVAVLSEQGLDVFERRRFERLESVCLEHTSNDTRDVFPASNVLGKKIARSARRLR